MDALSLAPARLASLGRAWWQRRLSPRERCVVSGTESEQGPRSRREGGQLTGRVLMATWRQAGPAGCARKLRAAVGVGLPVLVGGGRSARSVGAYFDLITDEGRLFYGDSFHLGYFPRGGESLGEALDAHTDLVAALARVSTAASVLDVGCGLAAPALR